MSPFAMRGPIRVVLCALGCLGTPALAWSAEPVNPPNIVTYVIRTKSGATYVGGWRPDGEDGGLLVTLANGDTVQVPRADILDVVPQAQLVKAVPAPAESAVVGHQTAVDLHVNRAGATIERKTRRLDGEDSWERVCADLCSTRLDNYYTYRITGKDITTSPDFLVRGAMAHLYVQAGQASRFRLGLGLLITGAVVTSIDLIAAIPAAGGSSPQSALPVVALVGAGSLSMLIAGIVLIRNHGTSVRVHVESGGD